MAFQKGNGHMFVNVSELAPTGEVCGVCPECSIPFVVYHSDCNRRVFVCIGCDIMYIEEDMD